MTKFLHHEWSFVGGPMAHPSNSKMAAAAIFNFGNRKLIRVTSSNEDLSICASISVTITDIWTKFGTEHKYHSTNTPELPNSHKVKIQDGGGRHLEFRKNVNNFGLDKDILHKII